jgi:RING finger protein 26
MMANSGAAAAAPPPPAAEPCEALGVQASSSEETRANAVEALRAELAEARLQRAEAERRRAEGERQIAALQVAAQQAAAEQDQRAACIVCQDRPTCMVVLPCRHVCLCEVCSRLPELRLCPLCREAIDGSLRVYL